VVVGGGEEKMSREEKRFILRKQGIRTDRG